MSDFESAAGYGAGECDGFGEMAGGGGGAGWVEM